MAGAPDPELRRAPVEEPLREEFPELALFCATVEGGSGATPPSVKERLRYMSSRFHGGRAVHLRTEPVPAAYRIFFRQVGLDPDQVRPPAEAVALRRVKEGAFVPRNLLDDALTIAIAETGVPVWAYDADRLSGPLRLRPSHGGEREDGTPEGRALPAGSLVVADDRGPVSRLFEPATPQRGVTPETSRTLLCALQVAGVPRISVEEAVWTCARVLLEG